MPLAKRTLCGSYRARRLMGSNPPISCFVESHEVDAARSKKTRMPNEREYD